MKKVVFMVMVSVFSLTLVQGIFADSEIMAADEPTELFYELKSHVDDVLGGMIFPLIAPTEEFSSESDRSEAIVDILNTDSVVSFASGNDSYFLGVDVIGQSMEGYVYLEETLPDGTERLIMYLDNPAHIADFLMYASCRAYTLTGNYGPEMLASEMIQRVYFN